MTEATTLVDASCGTRPRRWPPPLLLTEKVSAWGLELEETRFTLARLAGPGERPSLRQGVRRELSNETAFGDPAGREAWIEALRAARCLDSRRGSEVMVSLPGSLVDTYPLRVEATERRAFLAEVAAQATERLPYPLEEAVVDCLEIDETAVPGASRREILVAARAATVEFTLQLLGEAGFQPAAFEIPATALARLHHALEPTAPASLIVNVGDSSTTIACVRRGSVLVTRFIPWGLRPILERLEAALRIPRTGALRCLADFQPGRDRPISERAERVLGTLITPVLEELVSEVEKVWTYACAEFRGWRPERILLAGEAALTPAIGSSLQGLVAEPVTLLDPARRVRGMEAPWGEPQPRSAALAIPIGLALRESPWLPSS